MIPLTTILNISGRRNQQGGDGAWSIPRGRDPQAASGLSPPLDGIATLKSRFKAAAAPPSMGIRHLPRLAGRGQMQRADNASTEHPISAAKPPRSLEAALPEIAACSGNPRGLRRRAFCRTTLSPFWPHPPTRVALMAEAVEQFRERSFGRMRISLYGRTSSRSR
jgi:hypothetical protein